MEVTTKDGRVIEQKSITEEGKVRTVTPAYGVGGEVRGIEIKIDEKVERSETRDTDLGDRLHERTVISKDKNGEKKTVKETFEMDIDGTILSQTSEITTVENG